MSLEPSNPNLAEELQRLRVRVAELETAAARQDKAARVLRESEQLYRSLLETSPDCIVVTDLDGRIQMANQQAAVTHGYSGLDEMLGLNIMDLIALEYADQCRRDIQRIIDTGSLRDHQHPLRRKDGSTFTGEFTGVLIRDEKGLAKYILYHGRDVTSRTRLQRELIESQKLESIGRLAGGIAHDFNNLLAVILGNASLQLRNKSLPAKTLECLQDVVDAAERASSLTTQLLAYARGGLRKAVPTDVNRLVNNAVELLRGSGSREVEIQMQLAAELPDITIDQGQIQQVVVNLGLNAIQASPLPGKVEVATGLEEIASPRAEQLHLPAGRYVALRIRDFGCGMDAGTVERAFEPFFTTKAESRGMGLPAALGIVHSHNGRLLLRSTVGEGTEAIVYLPVAVPRDDRDSVPAEKLGAPPCGHETILVVDDGASPSRTAEQILASLGYCVVRHAEGHEALGFLETNAEDVDLVFLDLSACQERRNQMLTTLASGWPEVRVLCVVAGGLTVLPTTT